jgi:hypothetical protein
MFLKDILSDQFGKSFHALRSNKELKASIAWKLLPTSKRLKEHFEEYDKLRLDLCKKFATKGEDGEPLLIENQFTFPPEVANDFNKELQALHAVEIDLPDPKVKISDLKSVKLSVEDLEVLAGPVLIEA